MIKGASLSRMRSHKNGWNDKFSELKILQNSTNPCTTLHNQMPQKWGIQECCVRECGFELFSLLFELKLVSTSSTSTLPWARCVNTEYFIKHFPKIVTLMIITMSSIRYNCLEAEHRVIFLLHNDTSLSKWTLHDSSSSLNKLCIGRCVISQHSRQYTLQTTDGSADAADCPSDYGYLTFAIALPNAPHNVARYRIVIFSQHYGQCRNICSYVHILHF